MSHAVAKPSDITVPSTSLWAKLPLIGGVMALVGLLPTIGMMFGEHKARAHFSYLFAFAVVLSLALGGFIFVLIQHAVRAGWSTVVRRIGETTMMTLPVFILLWIPIGFLGFHDLYPWTHEEHLDEILQRKTWYLAPGFFYVRAVVFFAVWTIVPLFLYRWSTRQDAASGAERTSLTHKLWTLSAPGVALYALSQSFAAIDWLMSLQPHWYSTIFGVYFFAGSILSFFSFCALVAMGLQKAGMLKHAITAEHYHDIGKFMFGFTVFWGYIAFSQFILIWYANLPEETEFYMQRVHGGWAPISYALPVIHFFIPFLFLLSRHVKRSKTALAVAAVWILLVHVIDIYWIVLPNFGVHGEGHAEPHFAPSFTDVAALVGMAGAFFAAFGFWLNRNKVVCINDPRLEESLAHENY